MLHARPAFRGRAEESGISRMGEAEGPWGQGSRLSKDADGANPTLRHQRRVQVGREREESDINDDEGDLVLRERPALGRCGEAGGPGGTAGTAGTAGQGAVGGGLFISCLAVVSQGSIPSHLHSAGTYHVGFSPTRPILRARSAEEGWSSWVPVDFRTGGTSTASWRA